MENLLPKGADGVAVADAGVASSMTLVVKAANQKYNDQTVECQGSWTVKKLKAHLAEVYPCKPREHQQKIIFSGRLLQDHLVLKDVLRSFDAGSPTTVHLVCSPGVEAKEPTPSGSGVDAPAPSVRQRRTNAAAPGTRNAGSTTVRPAPTSPTSGADAVPAPPQVPYGFGASIPNPMTHPFAQSTTTTAQMPRITPEGYYAWIEAYRERYGQRPAAVAARESGSGSGGDAQNYHEQLWQYYTQYMQYLQLVQAYQWGRSPMFGVPASGSVQRSPAQLSNPAAAAAAGPAAGVPPVAAGNVGGAAAAVGAEAAAAGAGGRLNAGGGAMFEADDDEDEARNRDWLDWLYFLSRLGVLFSIIYFYSTLGRFMLVFGFCFLLYVFRHHVYGNRINNNDRNQRNNNFVDAAAPAAPAAAAGGGDAGGAAAAAGPAADAAGPAADAAPAEANAAAGEPGVVGAGQTEGRRENERMGQEQREGEDRQQGAPADGTRVVVPQERQSVWTVAVAVLTSFLSSLVPQPPGN